MRQLFISLICIISALNLFGADIMYNNVKYDVKHTGNLVFFGIRNPVIDMSIYNTYRTEHRRCNIKCTIKSDSGELIYLLTQQVDIPPADSVNVSFSFYSPNPGFYRVLLEDGDNYIKELNICYEPEKIYKDYPYKEKSEIFWREAMNKAKLNSAQYKMAKIKEKQYREREVYSVSIKYPNMEVLHGYYFVPVKKKENLIARARILYGNKIDIDKESRYNGGCIDFILPIDSLITPDSLFYKNTFIKYLAVVEFLSSKTGLDINNIFALGEGITGGIALAAAAMDTRIKAVAVYNPFINETGLKQGSNMQLERIASLVKCPVLFGIGLQDSIVSPRRIFDAYNVVGAYKEYYIFPFSGKEEHEKWDMLKNNFLLKYK